MNMKIPEFGSLQMVRTDALHFGNGKITPVTYNKPGLEAVSGVTGVNSKTEAASISRAQTPSFQQYLMDAVNSVNSSQIDVNDIQEKLITNPDDVDVHDVTIAMAKARQSLNLAQSVIDRLITGWNEITTTR